MKRNTFLKGILMIWLWVLGFMLCGCHSSVVLEEEETRREETTREPAESTQESKSIYVHICGAVKEPGVYELSAGDRADAAVKAAGGFLKDADEKAINLAEILSDGMQIYVPAMDEEYGVAGSSLQGAKSAGNFGLINLNSASMEELMTLSGIGESKALAIIQYREENGRFASIEEIKNVKGIGDGIFEQIKESITI